MRGNFRKKEGFYNMVNKFIHLLRKDTQMQKGFLLLVAVFGIFFFLKRVDAVQDKLIKQLQAQKNLVAQISTLEKQQTIAPVTKHSLSGIIFNKEAEPVAVINNTLVKVGDLIGPHTKVVSINNDNVIINDGVKEIELKLPE